jgi:glyoxylase-like metal-dependent hydrolase (beta-lactamase superfamily II)
MSGEIGKLNQPASVRRWQMDEITFTYIVDGTMWMNPESFLPEIPTEYWIDHPEGIDGQGRIVMPAGGLLVESGEYRLLVDAGLGHVTGEFPAGSAESGKFLECLDRVGVRPSDISTLALTHLHADHIGWMFSHDEIGTLLPTFPNARYALAKAEWRTLTRAEASCQTIAGVSVIEPIRHHDRLTLFADGDEFAPGVTALVTPGHSPGHTSFAITSAAGRRLIAFGDCFHVPAQLTHPTWTSAPDWTPEAVPTARARILEELAAPNTFAFGTHFGDQPFGQLQKAADRAPRWKPIPTAVHSLT